jgi:hypothetical protein
VVLLAWLKLYRKMPTVFELIAIVLHDVGYWGCDDMDGECGILHPVRGAHLTTRVARGLLFLLRPLGIKRPHLWELNQFCMFHSSALAADMGAKPSRLCAPDKLSILFEPRWFYLLRARLSGEIHEYTSRAPRRMSQAQWFDWLKEKQRKKYENYPANKKDQDPEPYL